MICPNILNLYANSGPSYIMDGQGLFSMLISPSVEYKILLLHQMATSDPMISNLSGFFLSTIIPHTIDEIMNIPPYAAICSSKMRWLECRNNTV
jgi:hypothetical protein